MMLAKHLNYHGLRVFFESLNEFKELCKRNRIDFTLDNETYSDLFYGTDADIYIPLWASVAKTGEDVLLNHVTLEVIKGYKAYGYEHINMDGNPADFIGEQFRFLEYLSGCALNGSMNMAEASKAIDSFEEQFLIDTIHMVRKELAKLYAGGASLYADACSHGTSPCTGSIPKDISFVLSLLDAVTKREYFGWDKKTAKLLSWHKCPALSAEEPHKVSVASFCDCGSKCKMLATVSEGCLLYIEPDTDGTPIRFAGCPRGRAYGHTYLTSKRLRYPMVRRSDRGDGKFKRITWDEATSLVAEATQNAGRTYGPGSRFVINAAGVCAATRGDRFMKNLLALDGGYLDYYNYYSAACAVYITPYLYGTVLGGNHESTYVNSKLIIMWGFNPATCHYGLETKDYFARAKENGAKIIAIDPRKSDSVMAYADQWIPIKPSSDTALIDAMAYVIWSENLQDQDFMDKFCVGFDEEHMPEGIPDGESYKSYIFGLKDGIEKTPQWAEPITGVPAETIRQLAIEYATTKPAALLPGYAPQRTLVGEQACRGFIALACMTGNVGLLGGSTGVPYLKQGHGGPGLFLIDNPYPGAIPVFHWTRAIDDPESIDPVYRGLKGVPKLDSGIKVLYSLASGIVINQHSNINDTKRILRTPGKLDCLVLSDLFMTPSARFADILLPGISFFELSNIPSTWADDDYLLYNNAITKPLFGGRFEYDWIAQVAEKMGLKEEFDDGCSDNEGWIRRVYEECRISEPELPDYDSFRKKGFYIFKEHKPKVVFEKNIKEGIPFDTPSGKIEIFSKTLYNLGRPEEIPGTPRHIFCAEGPEDRFKAKYPLQLIAYHTKKRCHSQHDQNKLLQELDPTALWINPADASERGIKTGDMVEIFNDRGIIRIPAKVTDRIVQGVIAVSEGGWYKEAADGADIGGSINVLTMTDKATPIANGNPQHTNLADVRPAKA